ncbi:uncharacterized protein [Littorina saxatilis]|uniref:uncharacterized protein n=1 Tax=Littorina saxatilis TaxID=31220 RepID=UPI0038B5DC07
MWHAHTGKARCKVAGERFLTPPGYKLKSFPRATRGGGLAVLYRDHLLVTLNATFPFAHTTLELLQFTLTAPHHIHMFCLYRPPPSKKNKLLDSTFLTELPDLFDFCNLLRGKSIIVGDLNVHYDVPTHPLTSKVLDILNRFSFVQGVQEPTYYRSGHNIDWAVYREDDLLVNSCAVNHMISSDHAAVLCTLNVARPQRQPVYRTVRDVKAIDRDAFKADITAMLQELGPDVTAQQLEDGLRRLLDKHASATERRVRLGRTSPWYSAISGQLRQAKRDHIPTEDLSDAFSDFFSSKVQKIREELDSATPTPSSPFTDDVEQTASSFVGFRPVTEQEVKRVITKSAPKTCALDPIPVPLLVECLDELLPVITSIINSSLLSGTFPSTFKQSIVLPLLKKPSLDPNTLKNYRSVSNLSFLSKIPEKLVLSQLSDYLHSHNLFPTTQSAYRAPSRYNLERLKTTLNTK